MTVHPFYDYSIGNIPGTLNPNHRRNRLCSNPPRRLRRESLPDNHGSYPMRGLTTPLRQPTPTDGRRPFSLGRTRLAKSDWPLAGGRPRPNGMTRRKSARAPGRRVAAPLRGGSGGSRPHPTGGRHVPLEGTGQSRNARPGNPLKQGKETPRQPKDTRPLSRGRVGEGVTPNQNATQCHEMPRKTKTPAPYQGQGRRGVDQNPPQKCPKSPKPPKYPPKWTLPGHIQPPKSTLKWSKMDTFGEKGKILTPRTYSEKGRRGGASPNPVCAKIPSPARRINPHALTH